MAKKEKNKEPEKKEIKPSKEEWGLKSMDDLDRLFNEFFQFKTAHPLWHGFSSWPDLEMPFKGKSPKVDIIDREKELLIRAELPGVNKEDLDVTLSDHSLTIKAKTSKEEKKEDGEYFRREISHGEFQRSLPLPANLDNDKAVAKFKDGILELTIPKLAASGRKNIEIK